MDWKDWLGKILTAGGDVLTKDTPEEQQRKEAEERRNNNILIGVLVFLGLVFVVTFGFVIFSKKS
jgi:hypothetical protein